MHCDRTWNSHKTILFQYSNFFITCMTFCLIQAKIIHQRIWKILSCIASNSQEYVPNFKLTSNLVLNMQKQRLVGTLQVRFSRKFHKIHRTRSVNFAKIFSIAFIKNTSRWVLLKITCVSHYVSWRIKTYGVNIWT